MLSKLLVQFSNVILYVPIMFHTDKLVKFPRNENIINYIISLHL